MPSLDGISPPIAFLAGLVSFISPCVLPLVPAYLAYLGARAGQPVVVSNGAAVATRTGPSLPVAAAGLAFVAGLSLIFILFFYVFSLIVYPIRTYVPIVAGVLVIVMALQVAGLIRIPFLWSEYRPVTQARPGGGIAGGFLLAVAPAVHPSLGAWIWAVAACAVPWRSSEWLDELRPAGKWFLIGCGVIGRKHFAE